MKLDGEKYFAFSVINFIFVAGHILLVLNFFAGKNREGFSSIITIALACALLVVLAQYPLLVRARNWLLRVLVFFLSMQVFMFLFGIAVRIIWEGFREGFPGMMSIVNSGLNMMVVGNVTGAFVGFLIITPMNFLLREFFF